MKTKHDWNPSDALTDEQIHAAALADPDAQPLTDERLSSMRRVSRAREMRPTELSGRDRVSLNLLEPQ